MSTDAELVRLREELEQARNYGADQYSHAKAMSEAVHRLKRELEDERRTLGRVLLLNVMRAQMNVFWALKLDETRAAWGREHTALVEARGDRDEFDRERCRLAKQLDRTLRSRKRLQARYDRARPVLKACEQWVQSWDDAEALPDPNELPAEAALFEAVMVWVGDNIDAEIARRRTCRRCTECEGEEHHWLTSMPECPEGGEPFIPCKHCDERAAVCEECCEAPVWPIVSNPPLCADCRLGEDVP